MKTVFSHSYILKGAFVLIFGLALGLGGPYGTYESFPVIPRLLFWITALFIPWMVWESLFVLATRLVPVELNQRLLMALLMPLFSVFGSAFVTMLGIQSGFLKSNYFRQEWPMSFVSWLVFSFLVMLPLILIGDELSRRQRKSGGSELLTFLTEKLPLKLRGGQLIAIKSEDHYLRTYTTLGDDLILMSMQDALTALSGYPGVRTHRSWWIALDQVQPITVEDKGLSEIQLLSGLKVPISRRRAKIVQLALSDFTDK